MKIGILSMQRIKNYGSFLQAFALKGILKNIGYEDVEFVDYHIEKPLIDDKKDSKLGKIIDILKGKEKLTHKLQYIMHKKNFGKKYFKELELTKDYNYNPELDALIIGSDEVFNCIQKNKNVGYSMELFGKNNKAKTLISYAASFGNTNMKKIEKYNKKDELTELLKSFDSISVRDKNSLNIVKQLTNKDPDYNLDPVLIYDYMNDCKLIPEINIKEKYMILYAYSNRITLEEAKYIKEYCTKKNIKIYSIGGAQPFADKFIDCSPFEVLAYFKNAEFIVTDTFHGSIFSIINHKKFITLVRKSVGDKYGNEEKLSDLLERLELKDRATYDISDISKLLNKTIDYKETDKIIDNERKLTIKYLKENLENAKKKRHIVNKKETCCGCGACVNICPVNAITLKEDDYGFVYPIIDKTKCINCGLCKKVCNFKKEKKEVDNEKKAYLAVNKSKDKLLTSSSGGVFIGIAEYIIENNGVVYGCAMENLIAKHIRVNSKEQLIKLQGSKYVQSDIGDSYSNVKKDLENNKLVLFTGTPCQVDGLKGYLGDKNYDNLYTVDIICHGVPNQRMFSDYLKLIEMKNNNNIIDFKFRDKSISGKKYRYSIKFEDNKYIKLPSYTSSYYQMFLDSIIDRSNCYKCPYAGKERISDLTIGDFWGALKEHEKEIESKDIEKGVSCILINTSKGEKLKNNIKNDIFLVKSSYSKIANHNKQLVKPTIEPKIRKKIMEIYKKQDYYELDQFYFRRYYFKNLLKKIRDILKKGRENK